MLRVCLVLQVKPLCNVSVSFHPAHLRVSQESTSLGVNSPFLGPTNEDSLRRFLSFNHQVTLPSCSHCFLDQNQDSSFCNSKDIIQLSHLSVPALPPILFPLCVHSRTLAAIFKPSSRNPLFLSFLQHSPSPASIPFIIQAAEK